MKSAITNLLARRERLEALEISNGSLTPKQEYELDAINKRIYEFEEENEQELDFND